MTFVNIIFPYNWSMWSINGNGYFWEKTLWL